MSIPYKRMIRSICLYLILPIVLLVVLLLGAFLAWRSYAQASIRQRMAIHSPQGIESLEAVAIGGVEQWIHIRGQDRCNPILLYVHGGPASTMMPTAHLYQALWESHFTVVQWDQRGAGKSYGGEDIAETLTIERMVSDTLDMAAYLRKRFDQEKIVLLGHSWGSFLGIHAIKQKPEWFHAYVGVGQVVYFCEQIQQGFTNTLAYARDSKHAEAIRDLEAVGPPSSRQAMSTYSLHVLQHWQQRFGFGWLHKRRGKLDLEEEAIKSPLYSLKEVFYQIDAGKVLSLSRLWLPFVQRDVSDLGYDFEIPVFFFSGRYDYTTTADLVERYVGLIQAPYKEHVLFEESAHIPNIDEPELFAEVLIHKVLPTCR